MKDFRAAIYVLIFSSAVILIAFIALSTWGQQWMHSIPRRQEARKEEKKIQASAARKWLKGAAASKQT